MLHNPVGVANICSEKWTKFSVNRSRSVAYGLKGGDNRRLYTISIGVIFPFSFLLSFFVLFHLFSLCFKSFVFITVSPYTTLLFPSFFDIFATI